MSSVHFFWKSCGMCRQWVLLSTETRLLTHSNTGGFQKHSAECSKSDVRTYLLCESTYIEFWNRLIHSERKKVVSKKLTWDVYVCEHVCKYAINIIGSLKVVCICVSVICGDLFDSNRRVLAWYTQLDCSHRLYKQLSLKMVICWWKLYLWGWASI